MPYNARFFLGQILKHPQSTNWFLPSQALKRTIDPDVLQWMKDEGSLTQRLKNYCPNRFSLVVLGEEWVKPDQSESKLLGNRPGEKVLLRQVHLKCSDQLCVYARSVIPLSTMQGKHRRLRHLGTKPLGEYLFASSTLQRSRIEWSKLTSSSALHQIALAGQKQTSEPIWGRRSLFRIDDKPLLVSEFFLPVLFRQPTTENDL